MAKKESLDVVSTPSPQFENSASVESGLSEFLVRLSSSCGSAFRLTCARSAENSAKKALDALTKNRASAPSEKTGLVAHIKNAVTQKEDSISVTVAMLEGWFSTYPPLAANYQSASVILNTLIKIGTKNTKILNRRATVRADLMTATTMSLLSPTTKYVYDPTPLCRRYRCLTVTDADRDFVYRYLRKNGTAGDQQIYWVADGASTVIVRDPKSGNIPLGDKEFWNLFNKANDKKLDAILKDIENAAYKYEEEKPDEGLPEISFDDRLLSFVPQCVLRYAILTRRTRIEDDGGDKVPKFDCYLVECSTGGLAERSGNRGKWKEALSKTLLNELSLDEIPYIKQFSNEEGNGITCIPLQGEYADGSTWCVDKLGTAGKMAAERGEGAPQLPSEFKNFFFGKSGAYCLFESDPDMSLLRLADFLYRVMIDGTSCRQCLVFAGSGKDGKSALVKVLFHTLGLPEVSLDPTQFGQESHTYKILNRALVYMAEVVKPSDVFKTSFFKALTGGDPIPMRKLFEMGFTWRPEHTRLIMTTNNSVYLLGDAQVSRCLPIACQKAYDPRSVRSEDEIIASCLTQRVEFLQWICDTVAYYKALKAPNGEGLGLFMPDRLMVVSDADFQELLAGTKSLLDMSERERRCVERKAIEATGNGRFYVRFGEDASDDEVEWFQILFNALFDVDADSMIKKSDITKALMQALEVDPATREIKSMDAKFAVEALGIKTFGSLRDRGLSSFRDWMLAEGLVRQVNYHNVLMLKGIRVKKFEQKPSLSDNDF